MSTIAEHLRTLNLMMSYDLDAQETAKSTAAAVADARAALLQAMQDESIKTAEGSGLQVTRRNRSVTTITDKNELDAYLVREGLVDTYTVTKRDDTAIKRDGAKQGWPGITIEVRDELAVREAE